MQCQDDVSSLFFRKKFTNTQLNVLTKIYVHTVPTESVKIHIYLEMQINPHIDSDILKTIIMPTIYVNLRDFYGSVLEKNVLGEGRF